MAKDTVEVLLEGGTERSIKKVLISLVWKYL